LREPAAALNRPTLEALVQYMAEQHFIPQPIQIADLFVPLAAAGHGYDFCAAVHRGAVQPPVSW
jgi:hypothetical protein